MNNYYVYEWIRLDSNEPFYVGKGTGNRWKHLVRDGNSHFNNIVSSIPVAVNILHDAEVYMKKLIPKFNRKSLKKCLDGLSKNPYYGELIIENKKIQLHWEYMN